MHFTQIHVTSTKLTDINHQYQLYWSQIMRVKDSKLTPLIDFYIIQFKLEIIFIICQGIV